ncbi:SulP family inorganic anion transporter [Thiohalobacter sp.]|uniref:SulP family inorganic anion transporter n=1 Tax=Thiohalobacter sp. TaxID=2025948 RepID=UPI0026033AD5|nr:SulP family inorganic anion transporter [Thiohalobacter sp.]
MQRPSPARAALERLTPFRAWLGELRDPSTWKADLPAGITVALVLVPQSMAYAQLAGLPPHIGLYASFLPVIVAALFGSSRQLATGPVAVVSLLTAAALGPLAASGSEGYLAYAAMLALMVGGFQILLGAFRLGILVDFLSHPVVVGFTNGAAIIIATSQLSRLFGVTVEKADRHYETVWRVLVAAVQGTHLPTMMMGLGALLLMLLLRRWRPQWPYVLVAVVLSTVISWSIGFSQERQIRVEQVADPVVAGLLRDELGLRSTLDTLRAELGRLEGEWETLQALHGADDDRTLAALHARNSLADDIAGLERRLNTGFAELRSVTLVLSDETPPRAWLADDLPPGTARLDEREWRIVGLGDEGIVALHSGGRVVGSIPTGLPALRMPALDPGIMLELLAAAITIALIGFMEAIAVARAMAAETRQRLDTNQELIGQGLANVASGLFQGYAVSGSFSRSAVNFSAGARTALSSVVTGSMVALTLLFLTPLLYHLPQAVLAAVIIVAVVNLVKIEPIRHALHVQKHDGIAAIVTFLLVLVLAPHLEMAIIAGVVLSLGLYLNRTMHPRFVELALHPDGTLRDADLHGLARDPHVAFLRFDGSLYFANSGYFETRVLEVLADHPELQVIVLDAEGINQIDATGEQMLRELVARLGTAGVALMVMAAKHQLMYALEHSGFVELLGRDRFCRTWYEALEYIEQHLGVALADDSPLRRWSERARIVKGEAVENTGGGEQ